MPFINNKVNTTNNVLSGNSLSVEAAGINIKPEFKLADSIEVPNSGIIALCACGNQTITRQEAMSDKEDSEVFSMQDLIPIDPSVEIHFIYPNKKMNICDLQKLHKQIYNFMNFYKIDLSEQDLDISKIIDLANRETGLFAYTSVYGYVVQRTYPHRNKSSELTLFYDNPFVAQSVCFAIMSTYNGFNAQEIKQDIAKLEFLQSKFNNFKEKLFNTNGFYVYDASKSRIKYSTIKSENMTINMAVNILNKKPVKFNIDITNKNDNIIL